MKCFIGIDLGSTTTKAVMMDENQEVLGRGITNSRSNYDTACRSGQAGGAHRTPVSRCSAGAGLVTGRSGDESSTISWTGS